MHGLRRFVHSCDHPVRVGEGDPEAGAAPGVRPVAEAGLVRLAELAGQVEAETGPTLFGAEERFEEPPGSRGVDAAAFVDHVDVRSPGPRIDPRLEPRPRAPGPGPAVADGVAEQVDEDLVQL